MEQPDHGNGFFWAAKLCNNVPETLSAHSIEGLGIVNKHCVQWPLLLLAFFLELVCCKDHVDCSSSPPKTALTLWKMAMFNMGIQPIQQNSGEDFPCNREQGDTSVVATGLAVSFLSCCSS